jgi:phage gpG-like protein
MITAELSSVPFLALSDNFVAVTNLALRNLANDVVALAKANIDPSKSGLHSRSGLLRSSIKLRRFYQLSPGGTAEAVIAAGNSRVPYARIHEYGGTIRAKNKPYLTFKIGNRWIRKKQVVIPARPYLGPAIEGVQERYQEHLSAAIKTIVKEL